MLVSLVGAVILLGIVNALEGSGFAYALAPWVVFTPVLLFGCVNRGLLAVGVALLSATAAFLSFIVYDLASLLYDPYVRLRETERAELRSVVDVPTIGTVAHQAGHGVGVVERQDDRRVVGVRSARAR